MEAQLKFEPNENAPIVNPNLYGHFAEHLGRGIYEGIWVGEDSPIPNTRGIRNDVVAALKELKIPVLRWPGGCFADDYNWRDGIGPRESRPSIFNAIWGGVVESNAFGTHEFLDLCEQIDAAPYISGNVGSSTVREMKEWVEYVTSDSDAPMPNLRRQNGRQEPWKLPYLGVGNESWGCGGSMRPEFYADLYRQYNSFIRGYAGNHVYRIACGANSRDTRWTDVLMERAGGMMDGLSLHNYTLRGGKWPPSGRATIFEEDEWIDVLSHALDMEGIIQSHIEVMDKHDPDKRVGMVIDEWGTWYECEPDTNPGFLHQQNSIRDALVAAVHLHMFHRYADRISMANVAQTVNVLQAMILTDGPRMLRTPSYWVFEMFKVHQGGKWIPIQIQTPSYSFDSVTIPKISATATESDAVYLSLANLDPRQPITVKAETSQDPIEARVLTADSMTAHNTFDQPDLVMPRTLTEVRQTSEGLLVELPPMSVAIVKLA